MDCLHSARLTDDEVPVACCQINDHIHVDFYSYHTKKQGRI